MQNHQRIDDTRPDLHRNRNSDVLTAYGPSHRGWDAFSGAFGYVPALQPVREAWAANLQLLESAEEQEPERWDGLS